MSTIFGKIIRGEIPCHKLREDDRFLAFLDVRPIRPGHTLVIPKREVDYLFDLDDDLLGGILLFARPIARALRAAAPCQRVGVIVAGLEVAHAHVHLVPIVSVQDLNFANAKPASAEELAQLAAKIREKLA